MVTSNLFNNRIISLHNLVILVEGIDLSVRINGQ